MSDSAPADSNPASLSTRAALRGARRDPAGGFEALLRKSESRLRVLLHFRLAEGPWAGVDPDDVLQEVWVEAARRIDRFEYRGKGSLHRWLAGLLSNKLLHAQRGEGRRPLPVSSVVPSEMHGALLEALSRVRTSASADARRREREARVRRILEELHEKQRRAILLRVYEGLSGRDAAEVEGVDESTMSVRLREAIRSIAEKLKRGAT
jgi:RNA polymerase sigma-70 factor (ECF subfamily)